MLNAGKIERIRDDICSFSHVKRCIGFVLPRICNVFNKGVNWLLMKKTKKDNSSKPRKAFAKGSDKLLAIKNAIKHMVSFLLDFIFQFLPVIILWIIQRLTTFEYSSSEYIVNFLQIIIVDSAASASGLSARRTSLQWKIYPLLLVFSVLLYVLVMTGQMTDENSKCILDFTVIMLLMYIFLKLMLCFNKETINES